MTSCVKCWMITSKKFKTRFIKKNTILWLARITEELAGLKWISCLYFFSAFTNSCGQAKSKEVKKNQKTIECVMTGSFWPQKNSSQ